MDFAITAELVRERVDAHADNVSDKLSDLSALYRHFGMPDVGAYSIYAITEELARRISGCFRVGHGTARQLVKFLHDDLIYEQVLDRKSIDPYFAVLAHVSDALLHGVHAQPSTVNQPIEGDWFAALDLACDSTLVYDWTNHAIRETLHARTYHVAEAAFRIRSLGATITRHQHTIELDAASDLKIARFIEDRVRRFGGVNVARRLFEQITPLYHPQQERYQLTRHVSMMSGGRPHIPFGHIALLAEKHATSRADTPLSPQGWASFCQIASDYAAILDVEPYTSNSSIYISSTLLIRHLQEIAVFDSVFTLPQLRPSDLVALLLGVLDVLDFDAKVNEKWTIREATDVIRILLVLSSDKRGPVVIDRRQLERMRPELARTTLVSILDDVLSHAPNDVNPAYCRPVDGQSAITFSRRPLIKHDARRYLLFDRSLCAPNCLEALFTPLRASIKNFDEVQVGPAIERFLRSRLERVGITPRSGTYAIGRKVRECDLIVETIDTIIFIEIKKKPLTFRARFGSDANLLIDLAGSVVKAIIQTGWHEYELRKQGYLDLTKDGKTYRLDLGTRRIERIALSLLDFGGFQDRVFIDCFLNSIRSAKFHTTDPALQASLDPLNKSIDELNKQVSLIAGLGVDVRHPVFHCWFLSLQQLMIVMDGVNGSEEFKTSLWSTRHMTSGSHDFYHEHAYMKKINAEAVTRSEQN